MINVCFVIVLAWILPVFKQKKSPRGSDSFSSPFFYKRKGELG